MVAAEKPRKSQFGRGAARIKVPHGGPRRGLFRHAGRCRACSDPVLHSDGRQFGCLGLVTVCALGLMLLSLRDWLSTYDRLSASESRGGAR